MISEGNIFKKRHRIKKKIARYFISGAIAAFVDLFLLYFFTDILEIWYIVSAVVAFLFAFIVSFSLQKYWTFRDFSKNGIHNQATSYLIVGIVNLSLNTLGMFLFVDYGGFHYLIAQIIVSGLIAIESFIVYHFIFLPEVKHPNDSSNLLILTQKINRDDPVLGFFHGWVAEFSKRFESITVICLEKGQFDLPVNVKVLSLGKEENTGKKDSRLKYAARFYRYIWQERNNYSSVLVHMNQEYAILGGLFWLLMGKEIYMWRNHHAGSLFTDLAAFFCTKVFCTSKYSYTAKYKKTILMPVGINTDLFEKKINIAKKPKSILFLGRISPVKRPDLLIDALSNLKEQGIDFTASLYGDALPVDYEYYNSLKRKVNEAGLADRIIFNSGIPNEKTVDVYNSHEVFINLSSSGMYDKTIFEAMACETLVLASNENLHNLIDERFIFKEGDLDNLTGKLIKIFLMPSEEKIGYAKRMREIVLNNHSLRQLSNEFFRIEKYGKK